LEYLFVFLIESHAQLNLIFQYLNQFLEVIGLVREIFVTLESFFNLFESFVALLYLKLAECTQEVI
jgi:hypothetical protein